MNTVPAQLWRAYLESIGEDPQSTSRTYTAWHFCDNEEDANELAALVKSGVKRATAGAYWWHEHTKEPLPQIGEHSVITDWAGNAQCIIRTTSVEIIAFDEVSAEFAQIEGEGDGSLDYWRRAHWDYFTRELSAMGQKPDNKMPIVCERFELVYP